ncbi:hypothetical protein BpHYR1_047705 [Brachionus plicatilis]|uniref:Uncharacterized protein n=1 Tax=Brachionus plicatilis TaxID=10195 RepID=A0A3M7RY90_BRAPC|nr:hypothetical protein BpHYR1_047705 [Brachionus plicatilis]
MKISSNEWSLIETLINIAALLRWSKYREVEDESEVGRTDSGDEFTRIHYIFQIFNANFSPGF